jgi:Flp pilus assembly protein TadG
MQATEKMSHKSMRRKQKGVATVEFALVALLFLLVLFIVIELARAMYICNTLQEVTRRAAAMASNADFSNSTAMQQIRQQAVFRNSPGFLTFAEPVSDARIYIDYMWIQRDGTNLTMVAIPEGSLPANPAVNYANCLGSPYSQGCVRLVRVRVCESATGESCTPVRYQSLVSLVRLSFNLPVSTTIANVETLGLPAGTPSEPCGCT